MAYLPPSTDKYPEFDPSTDWSRYCQSQGIEIEAPIVEQMNSLRLWLLRKSLPMALIGGVLFWGSLSIANATHRNNPQTDTLERLQIGSIINAQNGLLLSLLGLGTFFYLRKGKS